MNQHEVVIVGGGLAGLSTAYHLALAGQKNILVLEAEKQLGGHASGRNAGMIRQAVKDPVIAQVAVQGRRALARASKNGWNGLHFRSNGSLLLSSRASGGELAQTEKTLNRMKVGARRLSPAQSCKMVPILSGAGFKEALFCPTDVLLELKPLLGGFLSRLKSRGVAVRMGAAPSRINQTQKGFTLRVGREKISAGKLVNAAGAWCALIGEIAGAEKIPLSAYRRHLFHTPSNSWVRQEWPFVWDVDLDFYFRPSGKSLMMSPCDKVEVSRRYQMARKEKIDIFAKKLLDRKMKTFSPFFSNLVVSRAQSGLRTMAPDGRFVIGRDPKLADFYWVAGLGGHGVTTCFPVGEMAARIVSGKKIDATLSKAFSPARFA